MPHSAILRKVGGSVMLAIPPALLAVTRLSAGRHIAISVEGSRLVIETQERPRYALDELLAQCDSSAPCPSMSGSGWNRVPLAMSCSDGTWRYLPGLTRSNSRTRTARPAPGAGGFASCLQPYDQGACCPTHHQRRQLRAHRWFYSPTRRNRHADNRRCSL